MIIMKLYLCLLLIAIVCMIFPIVSPSAEESEWEILLEMNGFINQIALEGNYVWCAMNNDGVLRYNKTDGSYVQYTTENELPNNIVLNNWIRCIAVDKKGVKWIGVNFGIISFDDTTWTAYSSEDTGISYGPNNVAIDHDNVKWFTASEGIVAYNDTSFSFFDEYNNKICIYIDNNNYIFVGDFAKNKDV